MNARKFKTTETMPVLVIHDPTHREATCPGCHHKGIFEFAGVQHWPQKLTAITGISETRLWTCEHCHSTVSETRLK